MRVLASLPLLSLAAANLHRRDAATVTNVLTDISNQINALDTVVKAYTGGPIDSLTAANDKLLKTITAGTATITGSTPLTDTEAGTIAQSVVGLNTSTAAVVDDLIAKKSAFDDAGVGGTILKSIEAQAAASQDFAKALTALTPADLAPVASALSADIAANLQRGIAAYQGDKDKTPPPSSSGGSAPPPTKTSSSGTGVPTSGTCPTTSASRTHPHSHSSMTEAPTTPCSTESKAPNGTLSTTQTAPPAQYTSGSSAGRVGLLGGAVVGAVALVPILFL